LQRADRFGRLRVCAPYTEGGKPILVHSKVAVFDDRLLRVGSSNLNNRSFGHDTECDLAVEAAPDQVELRQAVRRIRDSLLAHYAGQSADHFEGAVQTSGSVTAVLDDAAFVSPVGFAPWFHRALAGWRS
jgi:phosphatidylserine/phosphatidylglycerophosphate/cardiolipin synthase-like enzyme